MTYRRRYSRAQLNAISRSYTAKYRKEAIEELAAIGVNYDAYCKAFNYKGSPCKLITDYKDGARRTVENINRFKSEHAAPESAV